jgi:hypothetical protein
MRVTRDITGSSAAYYVKTSIYGKDSWVPFTPLQPMIDAVRLLDCVPKFTRIPGVGIRWSVHHKGCIYELED